MRPVRCKVSTRTALFSTRGGVSGSICPHDYDVHDREKDFDYPRYLLIHTRPGRRSLFGAELARLIDFLVATAHMRTSWTLV